MLIIWFFCSSNLLADLEFVAGNAGRHVQIFAKTKSNSTYNTSVCSSTKENYPIGTSGSKADLLGGGGLCIATETRPVPIILRIRPFEV